MDFVLLRALVYLETFLDWTGDWWVNRKTGVMLVDQIVVLFWEHTHVIDSLVNVNKFELFLFALFDLSQVLVHLLLSFTISLCQYTISSL